jgi:hypothetical protein
VLPAGAAHGPGATRTRDLLLRRQSLYPPELRARRGLTYCGSSVSFHSSRLLSGSDSPIRVRIGYNRRPSLSSPAPLAIRVPSECTLELCPRSTASARNSAPRGEVTGRWTRPAPRGHRHPWNAGFRSGGGSRAPQTRAPRAVAAPVTGPPLGSSPARRQPGAHLGRQGRHLADHALTLRVPGHGSGGAGVDAGDPGARVCGP